MKKLRKKLGILGGSFDPPHKGHLKISLEAKRKFKLNKIIWAITEKSPFKKKSKDNLKKRIFLSKKVIQNNKYIKVKHFENNFNSNKTFYLLSYLKKKFSSYEIYFIIGADNLVNFHKWYKWKEICKIYKILVFDRSGFKKKSMNSIAYKKMGPEIFMFVKFKKINISSSKLRKI